MFFLALEESPGLLRPGRDRKVATAGRESDQGLGIDCDSGISFGKGSVVIVDAGSPFDGRLDLLERVVADHFAELGVKLVEQTTVPGARELAVLELAW